MPDYDFNFALIDDSGKTPPLVKPTIRVMISSGSKSILPGKIYNCEAKIRPDKDLKPGNYKLQVKRRFFVSRDEALDAVSVFVRVQIE